jgi:hypothetical protein
MPRKKSPENLVPRTFPIAAIQDSWLDEISKEKHISRGEIIRLAINKLMENQDSLVLAFPDKEKLAA